VTIEHERYDSYRRQLERLDAAITRDRADKNPAVMKWRADWALRMLAAKAAMKRAQARIRTEQTT
jgi:hypothetical protein